MADDPIESLQSRVSAETVVTVEFASKVKEATLQKIEGVERVQSLSGNKWQLIGPDQMDFRPEIFHFAVKEQLVLLEMQKQTFSVEDVFQELTKKQ